MNTRYYYLIIAVAVLASAIILLNRPSGPDGVVDVSVSPSSTPTPTPTISGKPVIRSSTKPTPGIIVNELVSYDAWVKYLDPLNRWLALDKDCTSIVPSQVDYPNNTEVMIDNSKSEQPRILKIGGREYSIDARSWIITTLSSERLPAQLPVYCGNIELGRYDLIAK